MVRRRRLPLSDDIRRDLGIWSAIAGIAHVVLGFQVHLGGRILAYFPANLFGLANVLGLAAAAILATLLALSNDRSIARLGGRRWKRAHRLSYPLLGLVLVHGVIYLQQEGRILPLLLVLAAVGGVVAAAQLAGAARVRAGEVAPFSGR